MTSIATPRGRSSTSGEASIIVSNPSAVVLTVFDVSLADDTAPSFTVSVPESFEIGPGDSLELVLDYLPSNSASVSGRLHIASDAGNQPVDSVVEVALAGTVDDS